MSARSNARSLGIFARRARQRRLGSKIENRSWAASFIAPQTPNAIAATIKQTHARESCLPCSCCDRLGCVRTMPCSALHATSVCQTFLTSPAPGSTRLRFGNYVLDVPQCDCRMAALRMQSGGHRRQRQLARCGTTRREVTRSKELRCVTEGVRSYVGRNQSGARADASWACTDTDESCSIRS